MKIPALDHAAGGRDLRRTIVQLRVAPAPTTFPINDEDALDPSSAAADGPGMPQTSTRNPFAMLPVNPLMSPCRR